MAPKKASGDLKILRTIVGVMTPADIKFVRRFYASLYDSSDEEERRGRLFDLIVNGETSVEACCKAIYGDLKHLHAFNKLKYRLRKDILNIIVLRDGPLDDEKEQTYRTNEIACRRLILQGDLLLKRGASEVGLKLLHKAEKIALDNELHAEGILISDILRTRKGFKSGIKAYEEYTDKIQRQYNMLGKMLDAKEINYRILLPNIFKKNMGDASVDFAEESRHTLEKNFRETGSPNLGYMYYLTNLYYYSLINDSENALENAVRFLEHIQEHKVIRSNTRLANANIQIANILINQLNFADSIPYSQAAASLFKPGGSNQLLAYELLFTAQFQSKELEACTATIEAVLSTPRTKLTAFNRSKWQFYKANLLFRQGQFAESLKMLALETELSKDKSGWLFGHKLLEILNMIELRQYDLVEFRIEALRKLLHRQRSKNVTRIKTVFSVLSSLSRNGFDIEELVLSSGDKLKMLESQKNGHTWDPQGYEIVRFDQWVREKS